MGGGVQILSAMLRGRYNISRRVKIPSAVGRYTMGSGSLYHG